MANVRVDATVQFFVVSPDDIDEHEAWVEAFGDAIVRVVDGLGRGPSRSDVIGPIEGSVSVTDWIETPHQGYV